MATTKQLEIKRLSTGDAGTFEGIASTYGDEPDSTGDVIARGAFSKSLAQHRDRGTYPALLWQHKQDTPIGVWTGLAEREDGLHVKGKLALDTEKGREAYALMKQGALSLSIGYTIQEQEAQGDGINLLKQINLVEISAVTIPANHQAKITSVKSAQAITRKEFESALRNAMGLSRNQAKAVAATGWRGIARDEQPGIDDGELAQLAKAVKSNTSILMKGI